jgi:hypothetical protein
VSSKATGTRSPGKEATAPALGVLFVRGDMLCVRNSSRVCRAVRYAVPGAILTVAWMRRWFNPCLCPDLWRRAGCEGDMLCVLDLVAASACRMSV